MSLIGKKVGSFKKNAYYNDEFIEVANKDIAGKWSIFFPAPKGRDTQTRLWSQGLLAQAIRPAPCG